MRQVAILFWFVVLLCFAGRAAASSDDTVNTLLAQSKAPPGVVFEIVSGDRDALRWAIPTVTRYTNQLRQRFPDISIAVVTHGDEQFALLAERETTNRDVHREVRNLSSQKDIAVHVCGTYAAMKDHAPEEFPDYVDVAAAGPATINDYRAIGFVHVLVTRKKPSK